MRIRFVHVKCIFTADQAEGGRNLCPTGFATAQQVSAQILDNIIAVPLCVCVCECVYCVNLFVAENYEHMNIIGSNVCVFVILDLVETYIVKNIAPMSGMCSCMWALMQPLLTSAPPLSLSVWQYVGPHNGQFRKNCAPLSRSISHSALHPLEFYGLQQKHNFIEANFIGKYGDEQRCKSSTNYIIVAVTQRILNAFWFECH